MIAGVFPPTAAAWNEQSRWDVFKQARDTVVAALAAPLTLAQFRAASGVLAASARRSKRQRQMQMTTLRKIADF